jgi:hypothetical protein
MPGTGNMQNLFFDVEVCLRPGKAKDMKIFLSWSGETSHRVANALHHWLPYILQSVRPFVSNTDISKGVRWGDALAAELRDTEYGIICITPYNILKPWMNFEAGALSKIVDRSHVSPFLFRLDRSSIAGPLSTGPLSQFQATVYSKDDVFNLVSSINNLLEREKRLSYDVLSQTFNVWWIELEKELDQVTDTQEAETETEYDWLFTPSDLRRMEAKATASYKSIWIITSDPFEHALKSGVSEMVIKNLKNGVEYKYFVPIARETEDIQKTEDIYKQMREMSKDNPSLLIVEEVEGNCFRTQAVTDYIIMIPGPNHDSNDHIKLRAFLKLPLPVKEGEYWIEVDDEKAAFGLMERFKNWPKQEASIGLDRA